MIRAWLTWFRHLPLSLKWFPLVVLLRPLIDNFFYLKHVSPFLSPLYIVGVLTPVLCMFAIVRRRRILRTQKNAFFAGFAFLLFFNGLFMFPVLNSFLDFLSIFLKVIAPIYLFYFIVRFINSYDNFVGIIVTFLMSMSFVVGLFVYEVLFNPIREEFSRGFERIQGNFGDVASYGLYLNIGLICAAFLYFSSNEIFVKRSTARNILFAFIFLGLIAQPRLNHMATLIVYLAQTTIILFFYFKKNLASALFFILVIAILYPIVLEYYEPPESVAGMVDTELSYLNEDEIDKFGHGRVGRLRSLFEDYFAEAPFHSKLFGMPLSADKQYTWIYGASGTHNEFVRTMMITGVTGFVFFMLFLFNFFTSVNRLEDQKKYIGFAVLVYFSLYSMSLTPLIYFPVLYFMLSVIVFYSLPQDYKMHTLRIFKKNVQNV